MPNPDGRRGGDICPVEDGGDAGRAVCMALRRVFVVVSGDEVRRRVELLSERDGECARWLELPEAVRE